LHQNNIYPKRIKVCDAFSINPAWHVSVFEKSVSPPADRRSAAAAINALLSVYVGAHCNSQFLRAVRLATYNAVISRRACFK
jgi:hypothetical protein